VNGADDVAGVLHIDRFGAVNDVAESEAEIAVAGGEEIQGTGVSIDGAPIDAVNVSDVFGAVPADKFVFDILTIGMAADGAFGLMGVEGSFGRARSVASGDFAV